MSSARSPRRTRSPSRATDLHDALLVEKRSPEDPVVHRRVHPAVCGNAGSSGHPVEIVERETTFARAILIDEQEIDGGVGGQVCDPVRQFLVREAGQIGEREPRFICLERASRLPFSNAMSRAPAPLTTNTCCRSG